MDTRDVELKDVPVVGNEGILPILWEAQKKLVDKYIGIEKMPMYPLDLNVPANQNLMKDLISRIVEELAEAEEAKDLGDIPGYHEELADAIHFMLEAMIFIEPSLSKWVMLMDTMFFERNKYSQFSQGVLDPLAWFDEYDISFDEEAIPKAMWAVTVDLNLGRNNLRNKPWKQTHVLAQIDPFKRRMVKAMLRLFGLSTRAMMGRHNVMIMYLKKNAVNVFRINSKY